MRPSDRKLSHSGSVSRRLLPMAITTNGDYHVSVTRHAQCESNSVDMRDGRPNENQSIIRPHEGSSSRASEKRDHPERKLWCLLRDRRLAEIKFRRQHCVGPYVVDFYCLSHRLVIELDGRSHDDRGESDRERQNYLESVAELRVIRIGNDDILNDPESVVLGLLRALRLPIV